MNLQCFSLFTIAVSQLAFIYAASSTPGGTLFISKSSKYSLSELFSRSKSCVTQFICSALRGNGGMPLAALSATWSA